MEEFVMRKFEKDIWEYLDESRWCCWIRQSMELPFYRNAVNIEDEEDTRLRVLLSSMILLENRKGRYDYDLLTDDELLRYIKQIQKFSEGDYTYFSIFSVPEYLNDVFTARHRFLTEENIPLISVMADIALVQGISPKDFKIYINDFACSVYPEYDLKLNSRKREDIEERLLILYKVFLKYFPLENNP